MACTIASIAFIAFGTFFVWVQHYGVPDRIAVEKCDTRSGGRASDALFNYAFGDFCIAAPGSAYQQRYPHESYPEFCGVYKKDVGHEINVHITRGTGQWYEAVNDAWILPQIAIGIGAVRASPRPTPCVPRSQAMSPSRDSGRDNPGTRRRPRGPGRAAPAAAAARRQR